jgi:hypothetical protein
MSRGARPRCHMHSETWDMPAKAGHS